MSLFTDPFQITSSVLGLVMGAIYGLSGYRDDGKSDDLSKNPRVRNLQWLVVGFFGIAISNVQAFAKQDLAYDERLWMLADYTVGISVGAVAVIGAVAVLICFVVRGRQKAVPGLRGRMGDVVLEYVQYGFRAYRVRMDEVEKQAREGYQDLPSLGELGEALAAVLAAAGVTRADAGRGADPDQLIDMALNGIEGVVKLFGSGVPDLLVETNYMSFSRGAPEGTTVIFAGKREAAEFQGYLTFVRYRQRRGPAVCLPVERIERAQALLPGAPTAAAETVPQCINTKRLEFREQVGKDVRREIETFFRDVRYISVLSVPITRGRDVVGVVNVETNHLNVVGKDPKLVREIGRAIAPMCYIMGQLIAGQEVGRVRGT